jgi:hypothetical protein
MPHFLAVLVLKKGGSSKTKKILGSTLFKLFKSRWVPGYTAVGAIP